MLLALGMLGAGPACTGLGGAAPQLDLPPPERGPGPPEILAVVSIAGLVPSRYRGEPPAMPALAALAREGVAADAVVGVAPAAEYPAHATLVTGRLPAAHGIVADRRLGDHGVRRARYSHASLLRAPTLWQAAAEARREVAALGWPTTVGASIAFLLPDVDGPARGGSWLESLRSAATPRALELAREAGGGEAEVSAPGAARDAVLVAIACRLTAEPKPPALLLLHLAQTSDPLARAGPDAPETRAAFAAADAQLARLLRCLADADRLATSAVAVVGDHGRIPIHTLAAPNVILARAGLQTPDPHSAALVSWSAFARSNGGSAFVYAEAEDDALLARRALESAAARTGAFQIVPAAQMLGHGADPAAWFGLEAEPGYAFSDSTDGPELAASAARAVGGYLPDRAEMDAGFVAWGRGLRRGVRVPSMRQTDVAPTLARLIGLELADADGRALVGVLEPPGSR